MSQYKESMKRLLGQSSHALEQATASSPPSASASSSSSGDVVTGNRKTSVSFDAIMQDTPEVDEEGGTNNGNGKSGGDTSGATVDFVPKKKIVTDEDESDDVAYGAVALPSKGGEIALFFHRFREDILSFLCIGWCLLFITYVNREQFLGNIHMTFLGLIAATLANCVPIGKLVVSSTLECE
jgi:hypothetical protein